MRSRSWTAAARTNGTLGGSSPPPVDRVVFRNSTVAVGAFRCPTGHPAFADSGPIENHIFVFPRRVVRLRHEGQRAFLADPSIVTLYNRHQRYSRSAVSRGGDDCEWFAVDSELLVDAVAQFDPAIRDRPERPFRFAFAPGDARTYLAQRAVFEHVQGALPVEALRVEEAVVGLLGQVLSRAYSFWGAPRHESATTRRQQDLAETVKGLLADRLGDAMSLPEIARAAGVSPFHLCRSFRATTGSTLHAFRNRLRLQHSLERIAAGVDLTSVGLDLGYSSHSHFTAAFRSLFGLTPKEARRRLAAAGSRPRTGGESGNRTRARGTPRP